MTLQEAILARHSVRKYISKPLTSEQISTIQAEIDACNSEGNLHIQLVLNERKAFKGLSSYGKFSGVENYIVMAGARTGDLNERVGYYGERLVLLAQTLGLNTCWVGLTYRKTGDYVLNSGEKLCCVIALGYGVSQGREHKIKTPEQISNVGADTPDWFLRGVEAALLAPSAVNQQKYSFRYVPATEGENPTVIADSGFSLLGYTKMDLGIARYHFEIGAGKENFNWG